MASDGQTIVAVGDKGSILVEGNDGLFGVVESGTGGGLRGVAHANGVWVACGDGGMVSRSVDGFNWTAARPTTSDLWDIHAANGLFVAVGKSGRVVTSPDGLSWTQRSTGNTNQWLTGVAYGNGVWVAVGWGVSVAVSTDAANWSLPATGLGVQLNTVTFDGTRFLASGNSTQGSVVSSVDGQTWQTLVSGPYGFSNLHAAQSLLMAGAGGGRVAVSSDGVSWNYKNTGLMGSLQAVHHRAGKWYAVGAGGGIASSTDLESWTVLADGPTGAIQDAIWTGTEWLAVGDTILKSGDGQTWRSLGNATGWRLNAISAGPEKMVAAGAYGTILWSVDGESWVTAASGTTTEFIDIVWHQGKWFAITANGVVCSSADAVNWTLGSVGGVVWLAALASDGNVLVAAASDGSVKVTTDGLIWQSQATGNSSQWMDIAWLDGRFVLVGSSSSIAYSDDAMVWTSAVCPNDFRPDRIAASSGKGFVAMGGGSILHSTDGATWGPQKFLAGGSWQRIAGTPAGFLISSGSASGPTALGISSNGLDWQIPWPGDFGTYSKMASSGRNMVGMVGSINGTLWIAENPMAWKDAGDLGGFQGALWSANIRSCQWTGAEYIVSGTAGRVAWSSDGLQWSSGGANSSRDFVDAIARGTAIVAVDSSGKLWFTPDRQNWNNLATTFSLSLSTIAAGPPGWVAGGNNGALAFSADGQSWTNVSLVGAGSGQIRQVRWIEGRFFAVGMGSNLWTSPDGQTWTATFAGTATQHGSHRAIAWSGRRYVVVGLGGRIFSSPDALTWTAASTPSGYDLDTVVWTGNGFYASGTNGAVISEPDHEAWALASGLPPHLASWDSDLGGVSAGLARVLGGEPLSAGRNLPRVDTAISPPALEWTRASDAPDNTRVSVETSTDLEIWTRVAWKNGDFPWRAGNAITETSQPDGSVRVRYQADAPVEDRQYYRLRFQRFGD